MLGMPYLKGSQQGGYRQLVVFDNRYCQAILPKKQIAYNKNTKGIYDHEYEVFMECEALKEVVNSHATHDKLM